MKYDHTTIDREALVWAAFFKTLDEAGLLPERIEDAPVHFAAHYRLMRKHDPRLNALTDAEIREALGEGQAEDYPLTDVEIMEARETGD